MKLHSSSKNIEYKAIGLYPISKKVLQDRSLMSNQNLVLYNHIPKYSNLFENEFTNENRPFMLNHKDVMTGLFSDQYINIFKNLFVTFNEIDRSIIQDCLLRLIEEALNFRYTYSQFSDIDKKINDLKEYYNFKDEIRVINFLKENTGIIEHLVDAKNKIAKIFRDHNNLCLDVLVEPEGGGKELILIIETSINPEDAFSLKMQLAEEWYFNLPDEIQDKLSFLEKYI